VGPRVHGGRVVVAVRTEIAPIAATVTVLVRTLCAVVPMQRIARRAVAIVIDVVAVGGRHAADPDVVDGPVTAGIEAEAYALARGGRVADHAGPMRQRGLGRRPRVGLDPPVGVLPGPCQRRVPTQR